LGIFRMLERLMASSSTDDPPSQLNIRPFLKSTYGVKPTRGKSRIAEQSKMNRGLTDARKRFGVIAFLASRA